MPPRKRRSYTTEYKVEAAHRVIDTDRTIAEVARELGIDAGMLSVWVKHERRRITAAEVHGEKPLEAAERALTRWPTTCCTASPNRAMRTRLRLRWS